MADEVVMETLDEMLPLAEIRQRYPDRFVLLLPVDVEDMKLRGGVVRAHCATHKPLSAVLKTFPVPRNFSIYWTGARVNPRSWFMSRVDRSA